MAISYNRLWKRLIDHDLSKTDMMHRANISTNVLARLGKGAPVSMESMEKICKVLNCNMLWNLFLIMKTEEKTHDYRRNQK